MRLSDWFSRARALLPGASRRRSTSKQTTGDSGEARAAALLQAAGLRVLKRNYRTRMGELDLVAQDGELLVFVEVRVRREGASGGRFGGAAASVNHAKQKRLTAAAQQYLANFATPTSTCRFDVVLMGATANDVEWIKNAFTL